MSTLEGLVIILSSSVSDPCFSSHQDLSQAMVDSDSYTEADSFAGNQSPSYRFTLGEVVAIIYEWENAKLIRTDYTDYSCGQWSQGSQGGIYEWTKHHNNALIIVIWFEFAFGKN